MSQETIVLAKNLDFKKVEYPVHVTEKLDGVPCIITKEPEGIIARTRQGETIYRSVHHILIEADKFMLIGDSLVGELYIPGKPFKDISGSVRKDAYAFDLKLYVWDFIPEIMDKGIFECRMQLWYKIHFEMQDELENIRIIPYDFAINENQLKQIIAESEAFNPEREGLVIRSLNSLWTPGKRSWGVQRWKGEETADLRLIGIEEAIDKNGKAKKMAGRLVCEFHDRTIGVGPGNLTHDIRVDMFNHPTAYVQRIIEVAYKPDQSYEALREARFKRFRDDKTEPSY